MFKYNYELDVFTCSFTPTQVQALMWAIDHACDFFHSTAFVALCCSANVEMRFSALRNSLDNLQLYAHATMEKYPELLH